MFGGKVFLQDLEIHFQLSAKNKIRVDVEGNRRQFIFLQKFEFNKPIKVSQATARKHEKSRKSWKFAFMSHAIEFL